MGLRGDDMGAREVIPQHECSRLGCTRLTSEQECDIHAAEPRIRMELQTAHGERRFVPVPVVHEAKEPRRRIELLLLGIFSAGMTDANDQSSEREIRKAGKEYAAHTAEILRAFDTLAAERDEWKRRAEALGYQGGR